MVECVLVTGGAGFLGSHLVRLLESRADVVVYDAFVNYSKTPEARYRSQLGARLVSFGENVIVVQGDVTDREFVRKTVSEHRPSKVVHLAAIPISEEANHRPALAVEVNIVGTTNLLEACRHAGCVDRFLYVSSSYVYGDFKYCPADESHPTDPKDVYGATKLAAEVLVKALAGRFGFDYTIVRPSGVYGPMDSNHRVSQIFVENAVYGKPLVLHDGGLAKIDFTYVSDTANGLLLALCSGHARNHTFNITRGEGRTIKEFAEALQAVVPGVEMRCEDVRDVKPKRGALDISKARAVLGFAPRYSLEDGIREYLRYARQSMHERQGM